jgi:hypothetical protein
VADDTISDAILENATGPKKASGDSSSMEQHPIADQIAADRYLKAREGVANPRRGLRFSKFIPPGAE